MAASRAVLAAALLLAALPLMPLVWPGAEAQSSSGSSTDPPPAATGGASGTSTAPPGQFKKCYCSSGAHAWVEFHDGVTDKRYARGFYAAGYGTSKSDAPPVPNAGEAPAAGSASATGGTSSASGPGGRDSSGAVKDGVSIITGVTGHVKDEGIARGDCVCFLVTKELYDKSARAVDDFPRVYRLLSQNCVDFVEYVSAAEGTILPSTSTWYGVSHPEVLQDAIRARKGLPPAGQVERVGSAGELAAPASGAASGAAQDASSGSVSSAAPTTTGAALLGRNSEAFLDSPFALAAVLEEEAAGTTYLLADVQATAGQPIRLRLGKELPLPRPLPPTGYLLAWDMGDRQTLLQAPEAAHAYAAPGTYRGSVVVIDGASPQPWWRGTFNITVAEANPAGPPLGKGSHLVVRNDPGAAARGNPLHLRLYGANGALLEEDVVRGSARLGVDLPPGGYRVAFGTRLNLAGAETGPVEVGQLTFALDEATAFEVGLEGAQAAAAAVRGGVGAVASGALGAGVFLATPPVLSHFAPQALARSPWLPRGAGLAAAALCFLPTALGML
jgi:hypothetical protein